MKSTSFFIVFLLTLDAFCSTYFVSPSGNDNNSGLATGQAFLTLQYASDMVEAGDSVMVMPGTYAGFYHTTSGEWDNYIVFHALEGTLIDEPNETTNDGINLEGADYILVEGFSITGVPRAGIRSVVNTGVIIQNNICSYCGKWGILTGFSENIVIQFNECHHSADEHGIYFSNSADNPLIHGNICHDNNANGIHMNADISMGGDGIISNATVTGNLIYNNGEAGGSGINCDGVQDSYIANNLLYNNHASGISLYMIDAAEPSSGTVVVNNTVLQPDDGRWALNIMDGCVGVIAFNNILLSDHSFRGSISADGTSAEALFSQNNITEDRMSVDGGDTVISLSEWAAETGQDSNSELGEANDLFIDPSTNDYNLSVNSDAVDAGVLSFDNGLAPLIDFYGETRPSGNGIDIGAIERQQPAAIDDFPRIGISWNEISGMTAIRIFDLSGKLVFDGNKSAFLDSVISPACWIFQSPKGNGLVFLAR